MTSEWLIAISAAFSAIAACAALFVAWFGPARAARQAEATRQEYERHNQIRLLKEKVFLDMVSNRWNFTSPDSLKAMNSVSIAFSSNKEVRQAVYELYESLSHVGKPNANHKWVALVRAMAKDLEFDDKIDWERITDTFGGSAA